MDFDNPKVYGDTFISDGLVKSYIDSQALYRVFREFHRMGVRCEQNDDEGESNNVCRKYAREVETTEVDISLK